MTGIDIALLMVIAVSAVIGLVRGLVREVMSLIVWVAAVVLALALAARVADLLAPYVDHEQARFVASFALVFVGTLVVGGVVGWLVGKAVDTSGLSGMDRTLGFVFGGARGAVLCIAAMIVLRSVAGEAPWWRSSVVISYLLPFETVVLDLFDETAAMVRGLASEI